MNTVKKRILTVFAVVVVLFGCTYVGYLQNLKAERQAGQKEFTLEVESERDNFSSSEQYESDAETLGEFLRTQDYVKYEDSEYGMYIREVYYPDDQANQYWWMISVDGEGAQTSADDISLKEGSVYTFTLMQGW